MSERNPSFDVKRDGAPRRSRRQALCILGSSALSFLFLVGPSRIARANSRLLDAPRAAGQVGERFDGYAVARGSVPADIAALVDKVNKERRDVYAARAASEHVPIEAIGKIYAAEIMKSAPAGTWFLSESGQWSQK
jgi:uncharacterized protein YdbL (DUF1318 family)